MAATLAPAVEVETGEAADLVSFEEAADLFAETELPASARTLQRWARQDGIVLRRQGRALQVSFSDLLVAHARRHPAGDGS